MMMTEGRWELKLGSKVMATDGECGHLSQLLLDPKQERVIAILVRLHGPIPYPAAVVPQRLIVEASEDNVQLKISREQVQTLPKYWPNSTLLVEDKYYEADEEVLAARGNQGVVLGRAPDLTESGMIDHPFTAPEYDFLGLRIGAGQKVFCLNGYAGSVSLILLDPEGHAKGFVMHTGLFPPTSRDVIVPALWVQEVDQKNVLLAAHKRDLEMLPDYSQDYVLADEINSAMWTDEVLRNTDYKEIKVSVKDGIVSLRGHVITTENKSRAEEAARSLKGTLGLENYLVIDQDLVIAVAQALEKNKLTQAERISVGAQNGVITLDGKVDSVSIRDAAEATAASVPQVRGVINYLQAPDIVIDTKEEQFFQPPIGGEVGAADMLVGKVERVIIDPHNRRVTAFIAHGFFPDPLIKNDRRLSNEDLQEQRLVVLPIDTVRYATDSTVLLKINGVDAAENPDYAPDKFVSPPSSWQPPYPYRQEEVLFKNLNLEERTYVTKNS